MPRKKGPSKQERMVAALDAAFDKAKSINRMVVNGTKEAAHALKLTEKLTGPDIKFLSEHGYAVDEQRIRGNSGNRTRVLYRLVEKYPMTKEELFGVPPTTTNKKEKEES